MTKNTGELSIPPLPQTEPTRGIMQGDIEKLDEDVKAAAASPNPARALIWNAYDEDIKSAIAQYDKQLQKTPGYTKPDWRLIKAMLWTETGPYAQNHQWEIAPMQSANQNDLGVSDLLRHADKMNLIIPGALHSALRSPNFSPENNIAAGIGYLLSRAALWGQQTVIDKKIVKTVTVSKGDSLDAIARRAGTSVAVLRQMNGQSLLQPLKPGIVLKYSPSKTVAAIIGWRALNPHSVYSLYNGNPGSDYADKVGFLYDLIRRNPILN